MLNRLDGVFASRRLGAEHHGVGAVEHGIRNVADLGARGHRIHNHRLHHLCGGDDDLVQLARAADHALLQRGHGRVADLDRQVATCHHDAVGGAQDFVQRRNRLDALDLRNQPGPVALTLARHVGKLARHFHVGGILRKTHGQVFGVKTHRRLDVFHVLGGQRRRREAATCPVDALVVRQLATGHDGGVNLLALHRIDRELEQAVVEQQRVAGFHVARQVLVVQADTAVVAQLAAGRVEDELLAGLEHRLATFELADANLRPLQIRHDRDFLARPRSDFTHEFGASDVVLRGAVREVQAHDVHAGANHAFQHFR